MRLSVTIGAVVCGTFQGTLSAQFDTVVVSYSDRSGAHMADTMIVQEFRPSTILIGTTVLPASDKNMDSRWQYGYALSEMHLTPCRTSEEDPGANEVMAISSTDSSFTIELKIASNCCHAFLGEIEIVDDTLLNLVYHPYGSFCSCMCCFGLTYDITRFPDEEYHPLAAVMINGDRRTLKRLRS